jgi:hypothetical protein
MFGSKASRIRALEAQVQSERQANWDLIAEISVLRDELDLARQAEPPDTPVSTHRFTEGWLRELLHRRE